MKGFGRDGLCQGQWGPCRVLELGAACGHFVGNWWYGEASWHHEPALICLQAQPAQLYNVLAGVAAEEVFSPASAGTAEPRHSHSSAASRVFSMRARCAGRGPAAALPDLARKAHLSPSAAPAAALHILVSQGFIAPASALVSRHTSKHLLAPATQASCLHSRLASKRGGCAGHISPASQSGHLCTQLAILSITCTSENHPDTQLHPGG